MEVVIGLAAVAVLVWVFWPKKKELAEANQQPAEVKPSVAEVAEKAEVVEKVEVVAEKPAPAKKAKKPAAAKKSPAKKKAPVKKKAA